MMKSLTIEKEQLKGMPASIKQCCLFLVLYPSKQLNIESLKCRIHVLGSGHYELKLFRKIPSLRVYFFLSEFL